MVKVIVGMMGSSVANGSAKMSTPAQVESFLSVVKKHNITEIDTARVYNKGKSEELLGDVKAGTDLGFEVSTKAPGFSPGSLSADKIKAACYASLKALKQEKMDIFYFHGPDRGTPFEEQCKAANELYQEGKFDRFGVSNLRVEEVSMIYDICKREGYMLPSIYQGGFNPLMRSAEEELFPTLRKLGMNFYAFSPLGGGYFSRSVEQLKNPDPDHRMAAFPVFNEMYVNDESLHLLEELTKVCAKNDTTVKEGVLRWFMHHSALEKDDGVILGASDEKQVDETLTACEQGRLPDEVVEAYNKLWPAYKHRAGSYAT